ncbi:hypothetical protein BJ508DRAFT_326328 [Ascobolus immersus RN42]|uniref:Uncharacterized protein n=1 Tax=Ascobolus immersus RN42 TaxID=1160509 RepID=A0A3N4I6C3_ASCIM|nr:hypothetical protein BJ508DRAFT_326328 [Ascobolus immersus RN42]
MSQHYEITDAAEFDGAEEEYFDSSGSEYMEKKRVNSGEGELAEEMDYEEDGEYQEGYDEADEQDEDFCDNSDFEEEDAYDEDAEEYPDEDSLAEGHQEAIGGNGDATMYDADDDAGGADQEFAYSDEEDIREKIDEELNGLQLTQSFQSLVDHAENLGHQHPEKQDLIPSRRTSPSLEGQPVQGQQQPAERPRKKRRLPQPGHSKQAPSNASKTDATPTADASEGGSQGTEGSQADNPTNNSDAEADAAQDEPSANEQASEQQTTKKARTRRPRRVDRITEVPEVISSLCDDDEYEQDQFEPTLEEYKSWTDRERLNYRIGISPGNPNRDSLVRDLRKEAQLVVYKLFNFKIDGRKVEDYGGIVWLKIITALSIRFGREYGWDDKLTNDFVTFLNSDIAHYANARRRKDKAKLEKENARIKAAAKLIASGNGGVPEREQPRKKRRVAAAETENLQKLAAGNAETAAKKKADKSKGRAKPTKAATGLTSDVAQVGLTDDADVGMSDKPVPSTQHTKKHRAGATGGKLPVSNRNSKSSAPAVPNRKGKFARPQTDPTRSNTHEEAPDIDMSDARTVPEVSEAANAARTQTGKVCFKLGKRGNVLKWIKPVKDFLLLINKLEEEEYFENYEWEKDVLFWSVDGRPGKPITAGDPLEPMYAAAAKGQQILLYRGNLEGEFVCGETNASVQSGTPARSAENGRRKRPRPIADDQAQQTPTARVPSTTTPATLGSTRSKNTAEASHLNATAKKPITRPVTTPSTPKQSQQSALQGTTKFNGIAKAPVTTQKRRDGGVKPPKSSSQAPDAVVRADPQQRNSRRNSMDVNSIGNGQSPATVSAPTVQNPLDQVASPPAKPPVRRQTTKVPSPPVSASNAVVSSSFTEAFSESTVETVRRTPVADGIPGGLPEEGLTVPPTLPEITATVASSVPASISPVPQSSVSVQSANAIIANAAVGEEKAEANKKSMDIPAFLESLHPDEILRIYQAALKTQPPPTPQSVLTPSPASLTPVSQEQTEQQLLAAPSQPLDHQDHQTQVGTDAEPQQCPVSDIPQPSVPRGSAPRPRGRGGYRGQKKTRVPAAETDKSPIEQPKEVAQPTSTETVSRRPSRAAAARLQVAGAFTLSSRRPASEIAADKKKKDARQNSKALEKEAIDSFTEERQQTS